MALYLWKPSGHFSKLPPHKLLIQNGRRSWDAGNTYKSPSTAGTANNRSTFTMPCFGRHGRWGNMVFQYIFMRILALNNNRDIELYRLKDSINNRMCLYRDMQHIPTVQTSANALLINDYRFEIGYIPRTVWRALYVSEIRKQKCYLIENVDAAINQPLPLIDDDVSVEVEGAFILGPASYKKQHKRYILSELVKPTDEFAAFIDNCLKQFAPDKTLIGIHIRRGDFIRNPLGQQFDLPVPTKYIIRWLGLNPAHLKNAVLFVSSDDQNAYKEIEAAGFKVFHKQTLLAQSDQSCRYNEFEQVEWEVLRRCDVLLNSNSSFSFSAALLSNKTPVCYRFSVKEKTFKSFDPWDSEPLQMYGFSNYLWAALYSRFTLVRQMVTFRMAWFRFSNDLKYFLNLQKTKLKYLYYIHGFSLKYFGKLFNLLELFRVPKN